MDKHTRHDRDDDLRPEYDLSQLKGGVRGKYYKRAMSGTNLVLIEPDLAEAFPDTAAVNRALRLLLDVARESSASPARRKCSTPSSKPRRASVVAG